MSIFTGRARVPEAAEPSPALADVPGAKAVRIAAHQLDEIAGLKAEVADLKQENHYQALCLHRTYRLAKDALRESRLGADTMLDVLKATGLVPSAKCPSPAEHARLYAQSERSWRLSAAQRAGEAEIGCPWCGGEAS